MKLRKIEPNEYEYPWENTGKIRYAVVLDEKWVIAAEHFKVYMPSGDRMEIFEVIE